MIFEIAYIYKQRNRTRSQVTAKWHSASAGADTKNTYVKFDYTTVGKRLQLCSQCGAFQTS